MSTVKMSNKFPREYSIFVAGGGKYPKGVDGDARN